jgi:electron transfer flavoprotein beta subunit
VNVVVLAKHIPDASGAISLGPDHLVDRSGEGVLDPGDEYAVEAALRIAEASGGETVVVSMGPSNAATGIRRAMSMGVDRGVLVTDDSLRGADALATARVLAAAVRRNGFDIVVAGVESTDGSTGTLPMAVAELLRVPAVTFCRKVEAAEGLLRAERQTEAGYDAVECPLPALVTVTASAAEPRYPTLKGIMGAKAKPLEELSLTDLGLAPEDVASTQSIAAVEPAQEKAAGIVIEDDGSAAARIADLLAEAKVI